MVCLILLSVKVCNNIENKFKILKPKWDTMKKTWWITLWREKHGQRIKKGQWYVVKNYQHLINEQK
jgi:hypothetical protein